MPVSDPSLVNPAFNLVRWVILCPLAGIALNLLLGGSLGKRTAGVVASLAAGASFVCSVILALMVYQYPEPVAVTLGDWMTAGRLDIPWSFRIDTLSVTMMLVVSGVGTLIHIYAIGYMADDVQHQGDPSRYDRFFLFFNLFILAMMVLVTANNYLVMFIGWEGVGLCSYLLIGFWFEKGENGIGNALAAKKAFVVNRIGDVGMLLALFLIIWLFGSVSFEDVFNNAEQLLQINPIFLTLITLFLLVAVTGKSAQLPLYIWLPDAMAGPTPVSALIHAATMVTAGVYLIARSAPLFSLAPQSGAVVMWVGALTALFAAGVALTQWDIKKVLAYSTISQLGYMVAAVGMGAYVAGMFHLVTHAFFKALLFLAAGSVIQGLERGAVHAGAAEEGQDAVHPPAHGIDPQDMRSMGGLRERMPVTFWVFLIGALALSGIAPLAGFFSKDEILAAASHTSPWIYIILAASAFLTAFYMGRQLLLVFFGQPRTEEARSASESKAIITVPLIILAILSVIGGILNLPGMHWLQTWLEYSIQPLEAEGFVGWVALASVGLSVLGLLLAWLVYGKRQMRLTDPDPLETEAGFLFRGLSRKWWLEDLYDYLIVKPYGKDPFASFTGWMAGAMDLKFIDNISHALAWLARQLGRLFGMLENGYVRSYALYFLGGVVVIFLLLLSR